MVLAICLENFVLIPVFELQCGVSSYAIALRPGVCLLDSMKPVYDNVHELPVVFATTGVHGSVLRWALAVWVCAWNAVPRARA